MKINLSDRLISKLQEENIENINIDLKGNPSCKGFEYNLVVGLEEPNKNKENFDIHTVDGINVYLSKDIIPESDDDLIEVNYKKFGRIENYMAELI